MSHDNQMQGVQTHFQEELREMTKTVFVEDSVLFPLVKTHIRPKISLFLFSEKINSLPQTQSFKFVSLSHGHKILHSMLFSLKM